MALLAPILARKPILGDPSQSARARADRLAPDPSSRLPFQILIRKHSRQYPGLEGPLPTKSPNDPPLWTSGARGCGSGQSGLTFLRRANGGGGHEAGAKKQAGVVVQTFSSTPSVMVSGAFHRFYSSGPPERPACLLTPKHQLRRVALWIVHRFSQVLPGMSFLALDSHSWILMLLGVI